MIKAHIPSQKEINKQLQVKDYLFWQSPYCRCCGKLMIKIKVADNKKQPHNLATLEHIYPATDIRRHTANGSRFWTLFCRHCNSEKGIVDCPGKMQAAYEKEYPAFDIRTLLPLCRSRTRWLYLIKRKQNALRKGKTFNIQQYR